MHSIGRALTVSACPMDPHARRLSLTSRVALLARLLLRRVDGVRLAPMSSGWLREHELSYAKHRNPSADTS